MNFKFFSSLISATGQTIDPSYIRDTFMNWGAGLAALGSTLFNFICGLFYNVVKWLLAFTDFLQYFIQKLIGLDYWVNNNVYSIEGATSSDLLFSFLYNDTIQKVFNTMLAVFAVLLIIFTVYAIIKSEWQYVTGKNFGDGTNSKAQIITNALKAIAMVLVFPLTLTLGIISSNAILASIYKALNIDMASTFGGTLFLIGSKNANRYRVYAKSGQRSAITDTIKFYVKDGLVIRYGSTDYNDGYINQYSDYAQYLRALREGNGATLYEVNTMFDMIDIGSGSFSGYCIGMDIGNQRQYYMVRCSSDNKVGMYYYLKNILRVDIMGDGETGDAGNRTIYNEIGRGNFSSSTGAKGFIDGKNFSGSSCEELWNAFWNTWGYASIYDTKHDFETSLGYSVLSRANDDSAILGENKSILSYMGLESFSSVKMLYNSSMMSTYFDGGQFGLVQLANEYHVMADVVDFMNNNGVTLYMLDMTSDMIDWNYGEYTVDSKWISYNNSTKSLNIMPSGTIPNGDSQYPFTNTPLANTTPFIVSYSDMVSDVESGNVLYTAKAGVSNELEGSKFIMCYKVVERDGTSTKYVPLVNRKAFTDPVTGNKYTFSSDYYSSDYRGVVIAKGVFANKTLLGSKVGNIDAMNGSPTYIKTGSKMQDGTSIDASKPYYYYMDVSGTVIQYAGYPSANYPSDTSASLGGLSFGDASDYVIRNNGSGEIFPTSGFDLSTVADGSNALKTSNSFKIQKKDDSGVYQDVTITPELLKQLNINLKYFLSNAVVDENADPDSYKKLANATFSGTESGKTIEFKFSADGGTKYFYIGYSDTEFYLMTFDSDSQTYIKYEDAINNNTIISKFETLNKSIVNGESPGDVTLGLGDNTLTIRDGISVDTAIYPNYSVTNMADSSGEVLQNRFKITGTDSITPDVIQTLVIPLEYTVSAGGSIFCSATYAGQSVTVNDGSGDKTYSLFTFVYQGTNYYLTVESTSDSFSVCSYSTTADGFVSNENSRDIVAKSRRYRLMYDYVSLSNSSEFGKEIAVLSPSDFTFQDNVSGNSNLQLFMTSEKQIVMGGKYQYVNIYFDTKGTGRLVTVDGNNKVTFAEPVEKNDDNTSYLYHSDEYTFKLFNYYTGEVGEPITVETGATMTSPSYENFTVTSSSINTNCWYLTTFSWDNLFKDNPGRFGVNSALLNPHTQFYYESNKKIFDEKNDGFTIKLTLQKNGTTYKVTATNTGMKDSTGLNKIYSFKLSEDGPTYYMTMRVNADASVTILDSYGNTIENSNFEATFMKDPTYTLTVGGTTINKEFHSYEFGNSFVQNGSIYVETNDLVDTSTSLGTTKLYMKLTDKNSLIYYDEVINGNPTIRAASIEEKSVTKVGLGLKEYNQDSDSLVAASESSEEGWSFSIWVSPEFSWNAQSNSYGLYNGRNYVATIYKNLGTEVNSPSEIASKSIRILYDGNTYYNISTQNKYNGDAEMLSYYNRIKGSFVTSFHRTSSNIENWKLSFAILPLINFRVHLSFGLYSMNRNIELDNSFKLSDGIQFDYFFENADVELETFYIQSKISYWILVIASVLIIKTLMTALWGIIKRFYEITLYFLAMPAVASTIPLDEGNKFKSGIQEPLIKKVLSTYGVILGINVFFILLAPVRSLSQVFTEQDIAESGTYFLKYLPISASMLNDYVYILFVLVAFTMIETLPGVISGLIGADDVYAKGKETKQQVSQNLSDAANAVSGKTLIDGTKNVVSKATNFIPGKNLVSGAFNKVNQAIDHKIGEWGEGFGRGYREKINSDGKDKKSEEGAPASGGGGSSRAANNLDGATEAENGRSFQDFNENTDSSLYDTLKAQYLADEGTSDEEFARAMFSTNNSASSSAIANLIRNSHGSSGEMGKLVSSMLGDKSINDLDDSALVNLAKESGNFNKLSDFANNHISLTLGEGVSGTLQEKIISNAKKDPELLGEAIMNLSNGKFSSAADAFAHRNDADVKKLMGSQGFADEVLLMAQTRDLQGKFKLGAWDLLSGKDQKRLIKKHGSNRMGSALGRSEAERNRAIAKAVKEVIKSDTSLSKELKNSVVKQIESDGIKFDSATNDQIVSVLVKNSKLLEKIKEISKYNAAMKARSELESSTTISRINNRLKKVETEMKKNDKTGIANSFMNGGNKLENDPQFIEAITKKVLEKINKN